MLVRDIHRESCLGHPSTASHVAGRPRERWQTLACTSRLVAIARLEEPTMRDLKRDWWRWTKAERLSAVLIAFGLSIGIPSMLLTQINSFTADRADQIARSK